jgi:hypothetical protein
MSQQVSLPSPQPPVDWPPIERRQAVRYHYPQAVSCFILPDYERFWAWAQNLSVSGIGIIGNRQLDPDAVIVIQLKSVPLPLLTLSARVVHCTSYPNQNWWLGCEFHQRLTDDKLSALLQAASVRIGPNS